MLPSKHSTILSRWKPVTVCTTSRLVSTSSTRIPLLTAKENKHSYRPSYKIGRCGYAAEARDIIQLKRKPNFDKILVANRGEIACRVIRTAKKLGIKTVAVYSDADKDSLHVKMADEAYGIGPPSSAQSYLAMDKIIDVCHRSRAQAVHPGYGFLSENANFSRRLAEEGIAFIGPPPSAIVSMGSKSESKNIMTDAGVPCIPGYHGDKQDPDFLFQESQQIGFPVLIKAIYGGGGKGMRVVTTPTPAAFLEALSSAKRESLKAFGNDSVLVEKYIETPRHVEVQIFADSHGNVVSLWERDCSVQRRNQKIIEEAPAPGLSPELRAELGEKATKAARAVNYVGAGTVEFIFDNDTKKFYFMEMNTRLQVEHPVTEMITGLDLVEWQLEVAAGNTLPLQQESIPMIGHAFEARVYAENPRNNFLPDSGTLQFLSTPTPTHTFAPTYFGGHNGKSIQSFDVGHITPSLRIEEGFTQGSLIGVYYDSMIAKVVVHGRDRAEALRMLRKALDEYRVVGVSTNVDFLRTLAENKAFIDAEVETGFISKHFNDLFPPFQDPSPLVVTQAALFVVLREQTLSPLHSANTTWTSLISRRFGGDNYRRTISFRSEESHGTATAEVMQSTPGVYDIKIHTKDGSESFLSVSAQLLDDNILLATIENTLHKSTIISRSSRDSDAVDKLHIFDGGHKVTLVIPPPNWFTSVEENSTATKGSLKAPMPSLVVEIKVKVGDKVEKGQAVVVIESMKTEAVLRSHTAGLVKAISCRNGEMVEEGKELVEIEPVPT